MKVSVILLSGGEGNRMGMTTPKQYLPLAGKAIATHSYDLFIHMPEVEEIIVVCHPEYRTNFTGPKTLFALPGMRRQDSLFNGLQQAKGELVCVHDAARPFISEEMVRNVIKAANEIGAATLGMPIKFTVKECDCDQFVKQTPDRSKLWEIQTPQVVKREWLLEGFEKTKRESLTVTDDVSLAEAIGRPVKVVEGAYSNVKITTPEDLK